MPAGSSRAERLDPCALPLRFQETDQAADERVRLVELHRHRVILRRALNGIKMAISLPLQAYLGVSIRLLPPTLQQEGAVSIMLEHSDPLLSLTLARTGDGNDIVQEWHSWGRALGLPLLIERDGRLCDPFNACGVRIAAAQSRRRGGATLRARRARMPLRRRSASVPLAALVHRGEREIIARS